jgi:hypothetical protein
MYGSRVEVTVVIFFWLLAARESMVGEEEMP